MKPTRIRIYWESVDGRQHVDEYMTADAIDRDAYGHALALPAYMHITDNPDAAADHEIARLNALGMKAWRTE